MNVVITGASRGLGKAMAETFAREGHQLWLSARRPQALQDTVDQLALQYPGASFRQRAVDLSIAAQARDLGRWIDSEMTARGPGEGVDVLINNAGQFVSGDLSTEPEGVLENLLAANLLSAYHLTRTLLPAMIRRGRGHIFNVCSIASLQPYPAGGSYSVSKFALAGFSKNLRLELQPHQIKVTTLYPGAIWTDSWSGSGVDSGRIMEAADLSELVLACTRLSPQACPEELVLRPQLGDL